jgi:hypothetical protein
MNGLQEITFELVRELRKNGHYSDSLKLHKAYLDDLKKCKRIELSNIRRIDRKIKIAFGICIMCKHKSMNGNILCKKCFDYKKKSYLKKYYYSRKNGSK